MLHHTSPLLLKILHRIFTRLFVCSVDNQHLYNNRLNSISLNLLVTFMVKLQIPWFKVSTIILAHDVAAQEKINYILPVYKLKVSLRPGGILNWLVHPSLWISRIPPLPLHLLSIVGRHFFKTFVVGFILFIDTKLFLFVGYSVINSETKIFNNLLKSSPSSPSSLISKTLKGYSLLNSILPCCLFYIGKTNLLIVTLLINLFSML